LWQDKNEKVFRFELLDNSPGKTLSRHVDWCSFCGHPYTVSLESQACLLYCLHNHLGVSAEKLKPIRALLWQGATPLAIVHENTAAHSDVVREWVDSWASAGYLRKNCDEHLHGEIMELHLVNIISYPEIGADM
jgi:hypothetical protein